MLNKIICGDCLEVMPKIPDKSIDMILCDLPYGTTACKWDTVIPFEPLWEQYKRIIKDNGAIVLTASQPFTSALVMSNIKMFKYEWIWIKNKTVGFTYSKIQPLRNTESILVFLDDKSNLLHKFGIYIKKLRIQKGLSLKDIGNICNEKWYHRGGKMYFETGFHFPSKRQYYILKKMLNIDDKYDILLDKPKYFPQGLKKINNPKMKNKKDTGKKWIYSTESLTEKNYLVEYENYPKQTLFFDSEKNTLHPTQKPVALFEYLIKTYTNEGELVLDNCIGSGTTAVACVNTGRNFIGIELNKECVKIAEKRIKAVPERLPL